MVDALRSYGVNEQEVAAGDLAAHAERIRLAGYCVLAGALSAADTADLASRLDEVLRRQTEEFGGERLEQIGDGFTARCPLVDDAAFLKLATHPRLLALVRLLLGEYVVLMQQNGVINPPQQGHTQGAYHRDLPYQHFVSSRPLAISALFCIDPFRAETGATMVIPGSHHVERFPSPEVAASAEVSVNADAGSFVVFDAMLFHRAGDNRSGRVRRAVNNVFSVPIIAQQISLPAALNGRYSDDRELARLLGYDSTPAASVVDWRTRRLRRSGKPMS
ncbi:MAG TPA: phytanoyl-CoA dioxygenase family protein [Vicinamibacterales bacterium]|nr:phytanoyl-CoA dioxygenase family protein [Vicinamibacterales bacterium]